MQMNNIIKLELDENATRLAGNPYGREIYRKQVKDKIDINNINTIEFPERIKKVASSFVQGFFTELLDTHGYYKMRNIIEIKLSTRG